jgi:hypothetical protein
MSITKVFDGIANTNTENLTALVNGATGFYIVAPDLSEEIELDFYVQFELNIFERNKRIRIQDDITLSDTLTLIPLPEELRNINSNNIKLLFLTDIQFYLEVYIIIPDKFDGEEDLEEIKTQLTELLEKVESSDKNIEVLLDIVLPLLTGTSGLPLLPASAVYLGSSQILSTNSLIGVAI